MKRICCFLVMMMVMLLAVVAYGADAPAATFGDTFSTFLTNTVFPIIGACILGFVSWAAQKIGAKYKIEALTTQNNFLTQLAGQGVAFAEEKAANYAKSANPISGNDKLNAAIAYVMQMAPKVTQEQAQSLVTSILAMIPGVGATGSAVVPAAVPIPVPVPAPVAVPLPVASDLLIEDNPLAVAPA